jgi:hypothetical protein
LAVIGVPEVHAERARAVLRDPREHSLVPVNRDDVEPRARNRCTTASPMPLAAPATTARLVAFSLMASSPCSGENRLQHCGTPNRTSGHVATTI